MRRPSRPGALRGPITLLRVIAAHVLGVFWLALIGYFVIAALGLRPSSSAPFLFSYWGGTVAVGAVLGVLRYWKDLRT
jgi:hypothetical protein